MFYVSRIFSTTPKGNYSEIVFSSWTIKWTTNKLTNYFVYGIIVIKCNESKTSFFPWSFVHENVGACNRAKLFEVFFKITFFKLFPYSSNKYLLDRWMWWSTASILKKQFEVTNIWRVNTISKTFFIKTYFLAL